MKDSDDADSSSSHLTSLKPIPGNGDCFYQCIVEAFLMDGVDVRDHGNVAAEDNEEGALALRRIAAMAVTEEMFQNFQLYNKADLDDFQFMSGVDNLDELREMIMVSGKEAGPKKCLWANEFEIEAVCKALDICCLILDMDTKDTSSKYAKVGLSREKFIVLHRSGEHYSLVFKKGVKNKGVVGLEDLTMRARINWKIG